MVLTILTFRQLDGFHSGKRGYARCEDDQVGCESTFDNRMAVVM